MINFDMPNENINGLQEQEKIRLETEKKQRRERRIVLARECSESRERFSFSGINADSYARMKADEEEFPGCVVPIDELVQRFTQEGMKIVFGTDVASGNIFVMPYESNDLKYGSILPKHLDIHEGMDEKLKELIILSKT